MRLAYDTESDGFLDQATKIHCICTVDVDTGETRDFNTLDDNILEGIDYLMSADELICHWQLGHDLPLIEKLHARAYTGAITDTFVYSKLLNPDRERPRGLTGKSGAHGLEAWGLRFGRPKPKHEEWQHYSEAMLHRCREDAQITYYTWQSLCQEMSGCNWTPAYDLECKVVKVIRQQEKNGVGFNMNLAKELMSELTTELNIAESSILELVHDKPKQHGVTINEPYIKNGSLRANVRQWYEEDLLCDERLIVGPFTRVQWTAFNPNSQQQLKELLYSLGWVPDTWNWKDGERTSPKVTESSFHTITGTVGEAIKRRSLVSHRRNTLKGWMASVDSRGRLPAGADTLGTNTYRFRHTVVVNVPKPKKNIYMGPQFRMLFCVPEPEYRMVGHDADQLELRLLGHYMNDPGYIQQFIDGEDIHDYNRQLARLDSRDTAKGFIYAFNYGAGDAKLGAMVGGGEKEGAALRRRFLLANPSLDRLLRNVKRAANKGWLKGLDGRRVRVRYKYGRPASPLNTLLQSAGAVVMKWSLVWLDEQVKLHGLDVEKMIDMHDEGQARVHKKDVKKYIELSEQSVVEAGKHFNLRIPLAASAVAGRNWSETH